MRDPIPQNLSVLSPLHVITKKVGDEFLKQNFTQKTFYSNIWFLPLLKSETKKSPYDTEATVDTVL